MPLTVDERKAVTEYRMKKAGDALTEAIDCAKMGHWTLTANRLYYATYYASSALLISAGYQAKTHEGTIRLLGQHFICTGILAKEDGITIARLQNMRHTGDYDDFFDWTQEDVEPFIKKVELFIQKVNGLIQKE